MDTNSVASRPSILPALLDQAQVADILGVSPRTLEDWRCCGTGPAFLKLSYRVVRYEHGAVEAFMKEARHGQTAA